MRKLVIILGIVLYVVIGMHFKKPKRDIDKIYKNLDDLHGKK